MSPELKYAIRFRGRNGEIYKHWTKMYIKRSWIIGYLGVGFIGIERLALGFYKIRKSLIAFVLISKTEFLIDDEYCSV